MTLAGFASCDYSQSAQNGFEKLITPNSIATYQRLDYRRTRRSPPGGPRLSHPGIHFGHSSVMCDQAGLVTLAIFADVSSSIMKGLMDYVSV